MNTSAARTALEPSVTFVSFILAGPPFGAVALVLWNLVQSAASGEFRSERLLEVTTSFVPLLMASYVGGGAQALVVGLVGAAFAKKGVAIVAAMGLVASLPVPIWFFWNHDSQILDGIAVLFVHWFAVIGGSILAHCLRRRTTR